MATPSGLNANSNPNKSYEVLPSPCDAVSSLNFSPAGNYLVATSWDNQVRCWEIQERNSQPKAAISHDLLVLCSAWKDDGITVFSGGSDKLVKMWLLMSGGQAIQVAAHDAPVKEVAWIQQLNLLVSGSWDKTLEYWDTRQQQPVHTQQLPERCYAMDVSYPLMVVGTADRNLIVYNLQNPQMEFKRVMSPLKYTTRCVTVFPDKKGFLVGSIEGKVGVHHLDDSLQSKNFVFKCHREGNKIYSINSLNFHPATRCGVFVVWVADQFECKDISCKQKLQTNYPDAAFVGIKTMRHLVHHTFTSSGSDGVFAFWDKDNKQKLKAMAKCGSPITCSSFNHNGSVFAYAVCYDWSRGAVHHSPATAKANIFLHFPEDSEVKPKPRPAATVGRKR